MNKFYIAAVLVLLVGTMRPMEERIAEMKNLLDPTGQKDDLFPRQLPKRLNNDHFQPDLESVPTSDLLYSVDDTRLNEALIYALSAKSYNWAQLLVNSGAKPSETTCFFNVTDHEQLDFLFKAGVDPCAENYDKGTVLHILCLGLEPPSLDMLKLVIEKGVDPRLKSQQGQTARQCFESRYPAAPQDCIKYLEMQEECFDKQFRIPIKLRLFTKKN